MKSLRQVFTLFFLAALAWSILAETQTIPVALSKDSDSASFSGSLKGEQTIDYVVSAKAGQTLRVTLQPSNESSYFNVLPPGPAEKAIFIGSVAGYEWAGELPVDGEYRVRTYLMGSTEKKNEGSSYALTIAIPTTLAPVAEDEPFDATGEIPCARYLGQPMASCRFGVTRGSDGEASMTVTFADGLVRHIFFKNGEATGTDMIEAEGSADFSASKEADLFSIRVGEERYEIPEAVVFGG